MSVAVDNEARALARVGQVLREKYRLDALLGIGGMATVYAATHRNAKRVAIKMLLPEYAHDEDVRARFVREGYAANTIDHPGALSVLDDDTTEEGLPYIVMELLEGETVDEKWRKSNYHLDLSEVLAITGALLDVLAAAHAKGIVHRDIKPENLFLVRGAGLKVLDFGIARVLEASRAKQTSTRAGTVMGTPAFMAPEQALAKWDDVDGRTDLWAVGATMFTLLTGQHVHEAGTGNEQLIKSATQPARSLGSVTKGLPRSVVALVDRALAFDRSLRWPDAKSMGEAVRGAYEALTGAPLVIEAPPATASLTGRRSSGADLPQSGPRPAPPKPPPPPVGGPPRRNSGQLTAAGYPVPPGATPTRPMVSGGSPPAPRTASGGMPAVRPMTDEKASMEDLMADAGKALAPPPMAALSVDAFVAQRRLERDAAAAEVARLQPIAAEIQARLAAVRKRITAGQEQVAATRKERTEADERFKRQMNARLEGVGEARKAFNKAMGEVAKIALTDKSVPLDVGANERAEIDRTRLIADARAKEAALHEAALMAYDKPALQRGLTLMFIAGLILMLLFFSPVILRSCTGDTGTLQTSGSGP